MKSCANAIANAEDGRLLSRLFRHKVQERARAVMEASEVWLLVGM
jgi:hypothetical protein